VITPSFNQARFLEATLRSILLQRYPNLELFVLDGGSRDGSIDIIRKYEPWLTFWTSEPDGGQSAAINRGLRMGSGAFATWINSDDMLERDALTNHVTRVGFEPGVVYAGDCLYIDENDRPLFVHRGRVHSLEELLRIRAVWRAPERRGHLVQPEVIFPRDLALDVGALDVQNHRTMDYELWGKLLLAGARLEYTHIRFGIFRIHGDQKTGQGWATTQSLVATAARLAARAQDVPAPVLQEIVADLHAYQCDYWHDTGPMARLGLPERWVLKLRDLHASMRRHAVNLVRGATAAR
jgi:glycosyltransferase involved in cell wall biosynthesis